MNIPVPENSKLSARYFNLTALLLVTLLLISATVGHAAGNPDLDSGEEPAMLNAGDRPWQITEWRLQVSFYTWHWHPEPRHNNHQHLIGLEAEFDDQWRLGAALFENSFNQNSQLVYVAREWDLLGSPYFYIKLMGGLLHGYKGEYRNKIPLNGLGTAPVILPAIGYHFEHFHIEAGFGGVAAVTMMVGYSF